MTDYYLSVSNNKSVFGTFISPILPLPWRETQLFARQVKAQIGKSTLATNNIKG